MTSGSFRCSGVPVFRDGKFTGEIDVPWRIIGDEPIYDKDGFFTGRFTNAREQVFDKGKWVTRQWPRELDKKE